MFDLHFLFGIFGNITALVLFLSPMITFSNIIKKKSTEKFSGVPYVSTLLNCLVSAWYGLPFVSSNNLLLVTMNSAGAVLELGYVIIFLFYCGDKKYRAKIFGLLMMVLTAFATIAMVSLLVFHGDRRKLLCGVATTIVSICMYASPLSVMMMVIKTKSVEYMPFFLSLFVFLCGTSFFIFGLTARDIYVEVPNGVGGLLGMSQLVLYAIYKDWKSFSKPEFAPFEEKQIAQKEDAMEMGYPNKRGNTNHYENQEDEK